MVESMRGFFEAYRPILKALQICDPEDITFGKYITPTEGQDIGAAVTNVNPPL